MDIKRISLFLGHYGSGKTFVSVNYALMLKELGKKVSIYDLDIVNPYFRTVDALELLTKHGIELVVSPFAESNVDIPAMNSASYKMIDDKSSNAVVDVGGDDRGALALGRFVDNIISENNYDVFFVLNKFRPETRTLDGALEIMKEIEYASKIKFTAIVNNGNLGSLTDEHTILEGFSFANEFSKKVNLPVKFTAVREDLITQSLKEKIKEILPVKPIKYGNWL